MFPVSAIHFAYGSIVCFIAIFFIGRYGLQLDSVASHLWADISWTIASFAASFACFYTAKHLSGSLKKAWLSFGLGCAAWFAGMLVWDYLELVNHQTTPFPALSDIGFLALAPFFVIGLLFYRMETPTATLTVKNSSDFGIIFTAIMISCVIVYYRPLHQLDVSFQYKITALIYPVLYISAFLFSLLVLASHGWNNSKKIILIISMNLAALAFTNTLYAYSLIERTYEAGHYLDIFWIISFALICWAAIEQNTLTNKEKQIRELLHRKMQNIEALLPAVALLLMVVAMWVFRNNLISGIIPYIVPFAIGFVIFIALRDWSIRKLELKLASDVQASEAQVRLLLNSTAEAIYGIDNDGNCTFANPACLRLLDYQDISELLGKNMFVLIGLSRAKSVNNTTQNGYTNQPLNNNEGIHLAQETLWRKDGSSFPAEIWSYPIHQPEGVVGSVVTFIDISERLVTQEQIISSEKELRTILSSMQDTYYRTDNKGRFVKVSDSISNLLGYTPEEVLGTELSRYYVEHHGREKFIKMLTRQGGALQNYEAQLRHKNGSTVWVSTNAQYYRDSNGHILGVEGTTRNVTDRKAAEDETYKLSSALQQTADAVMITDRDGIIEYVNPAFETVTGFSSQEALGNKPDIVKSEKQGKEFYIRLWETILSGESFSEVFVNRKKDRTLYYESKTITPLKDSAGNITHFVATGKDITEQMQTQQKLQHMAHHDALTGLPNRVLFLDRVKQALARARWHGRIVAVLFLDLDRFKPINDSYGHEYGDELLRWVGKRLKSGLREGDTVARFGGDEFVILLDDIASEKDVTQLAQKILDLLGPPFSINEQDVHISASIGVSMYPDDGEDSQTLLRNADIAMYRAKDFGKNNFKFYSDEMSVRAFERLTLENSLRHALDREEFRLYYQPQINIDSGKITGVEALLRWDHPDFGIVSPSDFVPLLEETGLIVGVGEWILQTACAHLAAWRKNGQNQLRLAINLSARQFNEPAFEHDIHRIIKDYSLDPTRIELEMTESVFMRNARSTTFAFNYLHGMGIRLALDDFGTGYSSLSYLKRFPIDTLKIDRTFVRDVTEDADDAALTSAIIVMAQSLGLNVVAEGVETEAQLEFLRKRGCKNVQGYLFSDPLSVEEMTVCLDQGLTYPFRSVAN
jgi:diguanylate cyclase (GGDEF)-like protein/PAS domain S-box-containing protein